MSNAAREKGKRGERAFAAWLRETFACDARRGVQYAGSPSSPDVEHSLDGIRFEVKSNRLRIDAAIEQVVADCGPSQIAVVAYKRDRGDWLFILRGADAQGFAERLLAALGRH